MIGACGRIHPEAFGPVRLGHLPFCHSAPWDLQSNFSTKGDQQRCIHINLVYVFTLIYFIPGKERMYNIHLSIHCVHIYFLYICTCMHIFIVKHVPMYIKTCVYIYIYINIYVSHIYKVYTCHSVVQTYVKSRSTG